MMPRLAMSASRGFTTTGGALLAASVVVGAIALPSAASAAPVPAPPTSLPAGFTSFVVADAPAGQSSPDDITRLGDDLFVAYQNGVGSDGAPAPSGAKQSTVVEYTLAGKQLASWTVTGKVDGMGADEGGKRVILSVNEDANSSAYIIKPSNPAAEQLKHYQYDKGLTHGGGTDSVVAYNGKIYVTASAPAPDTANGSTYSKPALYTAEFTDGAAGKDGVAALTPVFADNVKATDLVKGGAPTALNLNDPDSSEKIPAVVPNLGGKLLLDGQGDKQLVFSDGTGKDTPQVLNLPTELDDTAFATKATGTLYVVDSANKKILAITGPFTPGEAFSSVPKDSDTLAGALARLNLKTGELTPFLSLGSPKGLLFTDETFQAPAPSTTPSSSTSSSSATTAAASTPSSARTSAAAAGGTASATTSSQAAGANLAHTGANDTMTIAGIAAALLAAGAGVVYWTRRRRTGDHA